MNRLVQESSSSTCSYAPSSRATAEYQKLSGCDTRIPLGEDCGHWDNFCFENEIMTGFTGGNLLLSRMTIASLEDMGYVVNYDAADDYGVEDMDASCVCKRDVSSDLPVGGSQAANHKKAHEETTVRKLGTGASKLEFKQAQLSLSGRLEAESYGRQLLQEAKLRKKLIIQREGFVYLGDQVISVLYMEKGQIYGVEVRGD